MFLLNIYLFCGRDTWTLHAPCENVKWGENRIEEMFIWGFWAKNMVVFFYTVNSCFPHMFEVRGVGWHGWCRMTWPTRVSHCFGTRVSCLRLRLSRFSHLKEWCISWLILKSDAYVVLSDWTFTRCSLLKAEAFVCFTSKLIKHTRFWKGFQIRATAKKDSLIGYIVF